MGTYTVNIPTTTKSINIDDAPKCSCGNDFEFTQHIHKRKKTNEGVTAECINCGEQFYCYDEKTIVEKINRMVWGISKYIKED